MDWEFIAALLDGFIFYGILYSIPFFIVNYLKQHYVRKLCKYRGTKENPGRACVVCSYNHQCSQARKSPELKNYLYWRKLVPEKGKAIYDEIWEEENKLRLKKQKNSLSPFIAEKRNRKD